MKIRNGFVSNSSSSSFIVIGNDLNIPEFTGELIIGDSGELEFGWQIERYDDFYSRLNFTMLQAMYLDQERDDNNYQKMVEDTLKNNLNISRIINKLSFDYDCKYFAYIDHQSAAYEGDNIEMFTSEENLERFLFCSDSYIQCDNDNH